MSNFVYVGTYTAALPHVKPTAEGIYIYQFDPVTGGLTPVGVAKGIINPSYVALDAERRNLYAVTEVDSKQGDQFDGRVSAYAINAESGALTYLNSVSSLGASSCYLEVDKSGHYVLIANYTSGSVTVCPRLADGSLGEPCDFVQHNGSSVDKARQQGPHAHQIRVDAANHFVYVPDLGMDKVVVYQFDASQGKLILQAEAGISVAPGQGPRHFDFHPSGKFAYLINELGSTVVACQCDAASGKLTALQSLSTLPADFTGSSHCADIHVHPSGKFVYGSNRGHNSIAVFQVDQQSGQLTAAGHTATQGRTPRNFALDPSGKFLLAANQDTDTIASYHIDQETGALTPTGQLVAAPTPVCIQFA